MALKAWKGSIMTNTQTQLIRTIRELVAGSEHILFQLDQLEETILYDAERIASLEANVMELDDALDTSIGMIQSYKVSFEVEEKWRIDLQERNRAAVAEVATLTKKLEASSKRHKAIVEQVKGTDKDIGPKRRGRPTVKKEEISE